MSRQYQDPNYHSGQYQTTYPYPNPSQQSGQYTQPSPNPRDTYNDHPSQQAFSSYPTDGSLQPQPSGRRQSSHSPYAGPVPFPEPQGSPVGHPQAYLHPSQATPHLPVGTPQQGYQSSYGYPPSTSDGQRFYAADRSDAGGGSNFYSQGGGYSVAQPLDGNVAGYENLRERPKGRGNPPAGTHSRARPLCRYPGCGYTVFMDDRVQELREWCSDAHMQAAVANRVEKPCRTCQRWPRLNGYKYCSGDRCRFPGRY